MSQFLSALLSGRMLSTFCMGFSSGLPLLLIGGTLRAWMTEAKVDLTVIGFFASVQLPYSVKFLWAPLLDRYQIPFLGRRRGWIFFSQLAVAASLALLAYSQPEINPWLTAAAAFLVALFSATQDIVIDAYRRELLPEKELGLGSSMAVNGYRIALLVAGAGALALASFLPWKSTYLALALMMAACTIITLLSPEPAQSPAVPKTIGEAVIAPFREYFHRKGAWEILCFIVLFKIGDSLASDMFNPFYLETGFTKPQIAAIAKVLGLWSTIIGSLLGGIAILRWGMIRSLWVFGILQAVSTLGFSLQASVGINLGLLSVVIAFENLTSGMGTAAYTGYMASLCNKRFTATQYALLSSLMSIPRTIVGNSSGYLAKHLGWTSYFAFCAAIALPGLLMLLRTRKWESAE